MPGSGTWIFDDPEDFQARLHHTHADLLVTDRAAFKARLTWASLHYLCVLRAEEAASRVAHVSLPTAWSFVALPDPDPSPILWNGIPLTARDILLHGRGERFHQRTTGPCTWTLLALVPDHLARCATALSGEPLASLDAAGHVLHASARSMTRLRRLCAQVCRLAERNPKVLAHPEVAHAFEEDLIYPLVKCLATNRVPRGSAVLAHQVRVMTRFEEWLEEHLNQPLRLRDFCAEAGVTERTFRTYCTEFLGLGPH